MTQTPNPNPNRDLVAQWQDSAPDMRYDEWLVAEIDIQRELLDDIPSDDYDTLAATFDLITDLIAEVRTAAATATVLREWLGGREVIDFNTPEGRDRWSELHSGSVADELLNRIFAHRGDPIVINDGESVERYTLGATA